MIDPVRNFGWSLDEHVGAQPYGMWQRAFDPLLAPWVRNYWKSHNFSRLSDRALDIVVEYASRFPSPHCEIFIGLGGRMTHVAPDALAYSHRNATFVLNVHSRWERSKEDQRCVSWVHDLFNATAPYAIGGVYVNFMMQEEPERVPAADGC